MARLKCKIRSCRFSFKLFLIANKTIVPDFYLMAKFTFNNAKNTSISNVPFELNCGFHFEAFYKKDINLYF